MALILDTNAFSAYAEGDLNLRNIIEHEADLALPVVVLGEYLFGIYHSRKRSKYETWLKFILPELLVLQIDQSTAEQYAEVRSELKTAGTPIPSNDAWIAALARQHRYGIASRDRHFQAIRGIQTLTW
jgi:tRNA(fMet)-specific endonuclease VapC